MNVLIIWTENNKQYAMLYKRRSKEYAIESFRTYYPNIPYLDQVIEIKALYEDKNGLSLNIT